MMFVIQLYGRFNNIINYGHKKYIRFKTMPLWCINSITIYIVSVTI